MSHPTASDRGASQGANVAIELLPVGKGAYAIAWSAPWGAAAMMVRRFAEGSPRHAVLLGSAERTRAGAPRLFHVGDSVGVAWCEDDGAYLAVIDEGGMRGEPRPLLPGGRTLCLAAGRRATHVFVEDGEAVHAIEVRADGTITRSPEPLVEQTGRVRMAAARASEASLLLAAYHGDRRLAVVDAARGARSLVRHELPATCAALDAYGVGSRAAFALAYEAVGQRGGELIEAGVVDAAGKMVERRDAVLRSPGAAYSEVRVTWIEDAFHAIARDATQERAIVVRIEDRSPLLEVPRVSGAFAAAYHEKRFVLAQAPVAGDAPTVRLYTCDQRGGNAQTIELREPTPGAVRDRRADARAERCIEELEGALGSSGYRGARGARVHLARGTGLSLAAERQHVEIRPEQDRFRLVLAHLDPDAAGPPARDGSLERLARWVRERVSGDAKKRGDADRALGSELASAIGGELAHVERSEGGLRVEIDLRDPPDGPRLSAWLHRARQLTRGE